MTKNRTSGSNTIKSSASEKGRRLVRAAKTTRSAALMFRLKNSAKAEFILARKRKTPLYHSIKAPLHAVPLYFRKIKIFPFFVRLRGLPQTLLCPQTQKRTFTSFPNLHAFSPRRFSLSREEKATLFLLGIQFLFIIAYVFKKRNCFATYFKNKFSIRYSFNA